MKGTKLRLLSMAVVAVLAGLAPAAAQAQGTYSGTLNQAAPTSHTGSIGLVVSHGRISGLTLNFVLTCQGLGVVYDQDPVPGFTVPIGPAHGFSYAGTIGGRNLRITGSLKGGKAVGSVFQSFWFGDSFCTMDQPASYTASG